MARAGAGCALIENGDLRATPRQPPGDCEADDAGPDDGHVRLGVKACEAVRQPAAPFAGMTQTGSLGLISAALPRHPRPSTPMMGIPDPLYKAVARPHAADANQLHVQRWAGWRSSREHASPTAITTAAPKKMLGSGPPWAKP